MFPLKKEIPSIINFSDTLKECFKLKKNFQLLIYFNLHLVVTLLYKLGE